MSIRRTKSFQQCSWENPRLDEGSGPADVLKKTRTSRPTFRQKLKQQSCGRGPDRQGLLLMLNWVEPSILFHRRGLLLMLNGVSTLNPVSVTVINCSEGPVSKPAKSLSFLALSWGKLCVTLTHLPWQHTRWHTHLFTRRFVSNKAKFLLLLKTTDSQKTIIGPQLVVFSFPDENLCHRLTAASSLFTSHTSLTPQKGTQVTDNSVGCWF